jgi:hypothetical protein
MYRVSNNVACRLPFVDVTIPVIHRDTPTVGMSGSRSTVRKRCEVEGHEDDDE